MLNCLTSHQPDTAELRYNFPSLSPFLRLFSFRVSSPRSVWTREAGNTIRLATIVQQRLPYKVLLDGPGDMQSCFSPGFVACVKCHRYLVLEHRIVK